MAEFGELFQLCACFQQENVVGIEKHSEEDKVILTLKDRGVLVYKLSDQRLVSSWSFEQKQVPTCAAVHDVMTGSYITVINNNVICQWKEDAQDLQTAERTKVKKTVHKLLVSDGGVIIVYEDGEVCPLDNTSSKAQTRKKSERIIWCSAYEDKVLVIRNLSNTYSLSVHDLNGKTCTTHSLLPLSESSDSELCCCTVMPSLKQLVCLWSDGSLVKFSLSETSHEEDQHLQSQLIHKLSNLCTLTKSKKQLPSVLVTVDEHRVVFAGCTGDGKSSQDVFAVWDVRFGVLQSWKSLSSDDTALGVEHACCQSGNVITATSQAIVGCPVDIQPSSLASALGKMTSTMKFSTQSSVVSPDMLVTGKLVNPIQDMDSWSTELRIQHESEKQIIDKLLDTTQLKTAKQFHKELEKYIKSKRHSDEEMEVVESPETYDISQHFITSALSRCLSDDKVWSSKAVSTLLQTHCIPASSSKELIKTVVEKNDMDLLKECFQKITGIPEQSIVTCLVHVLSLEEESAEEEMETTEADETPHCRCPVSKETESHLHFILSYPMNDIFMQNCLKGLSFNNVVILLKFLLYFLKNTSAVADQTNNTSDDQLTYAQALDWAGLLINSHFTQLALVPEVQDLILEVQHSVEKQIATYNKLRSIEGYLNHFKKNQTLPKSQHVGLYSVETLEL